MIYVEKILKKYLIKLLEKDKMFKAKVQVLLEVEKLEFEINLLNQKWNLKKN